MAKRQEPQRKTPADVLRDLRAGHAACAAHGPAEAYLPELRICERGDRARAR